MPILTPLPPPAQKRKGRRPPPADRRSIKDRDDSLLSLTVFFWTSGSRKQCTRSATISSDSSWLRLGHTKTEGCAEYFSVTVHRERDSRKQHQQLTHSACRVKTNTANAFSSWVRKHPTTSDPFSSSDLIIKQHAHTCARTCAHTHTEIETN